MDIKVGLIIIAIGYCLIYFFDSFFKSCAHYPYIKFLEGTGLKIGFFNIQWKTKSFNRVFLRFSKSRSDKLINKWFSAGVLATLILLPLSIFLLIYSLFQSLLTKNDIILTPVVPGINLPASEILYYSLTLIISSVVHEFGHAFSALKEDVHVVEVGVYIIFILPVAFVNLSTEDVKNLVFWKRLKILSAGVWHNLVLSLACYLVYISLPVLLSSFYITGRGVIVYDASKLSPLIGEKGLTIGDRIINLNGCTVRSENDWTKCLDSISVESGICLNADDVRTFDESSPSKFTIDGFIQCCEDSKKGFVCFEFVDDKAILEFPPHVCLPVRKMFNKSVHYCSRKEKECPLTSSHCFIPLVNNSNLFTVEVIDKPNIIIYIGLVDDFRKTIKISPLFPKFSSGVPLFGETLKKLLEYIVTISLGLALINTIPCFFMDGEHILNSLLYIILSEKFRKGFINSLSSFICLCFTVLLVTHCLVTIVPLIF